jgi:NAD(P)-dependent dehydrogenase (short-subunit alcohol dehydrogenase family)
MTIDFSDKSILVTGGGSGIGLATAQRFAQLGGHVTICGRTAEKLEGAVAQINASNPSGSISSIVADVTVEDQIAAACDAAASATGRLDVLFACAGGAMHMGPLVDADADGVRATVDLNLIGSFLSLKHAARLMVPAKSGSVVLMSSGAGAFPHRWLWAYGMSKAGIDRLCTYAAEELGEHNIRVNSVQPGIVDDELMAAITAGGALLDDYIEQMPLGRLGTVDDIAAAVTFLASDDASWITGVNLGIDGGHHLRRGADYSKLFG